MNKLPTEEAVRLIRESPKNIYFPLSHFGIQFGLSPSEVLEELCSGRLRAEGKPTDSGYEDISITVYSYLCWITNPDTPAHLKEAVGTFLTQKAKQ
jgi:hypothetical protein